VSIVKRSRWSLFQAVLKNSMLESFGMSFELARDLTLMAVRLAMECGKTYHIQSFNILIRAKPHVLPKTSTLNKGTQDMPYISSRNSCCQDNQHIVHSQAPLLPSPPPEAEPAYGDDEDQGEESGGCGTCSPCIRLPRKIRLWRLWTGWTEWKLGIAAEQRPIFSHRMLDKAIAVG
jgi:hypothetical protein